MNLILPFLILLSDIHCKPFVAPENGLVTLSTYDVQCKDCAQCKDCIYGKDKRYEQERSNTSRSNLFSPSTYLSEFDTFTTDKKNGSETKPDNKTEIADVIDLLSKFRVAQLKQLRKYLTESLLTGVGIESNLDDYTATNKLASLRSPDISNLMRNKSVDAIEDLFRTIVKNGTIEKVWCGKQRSITDGSKCSLDELWALFNSTLLSALSQKEQDLLKPGSHSTVQYDGSSDSPILNLTDSVNHTSLGNITVELTVKLDGQEIGDVEMAKKLLENERQNSTKLKEESSPSSSSLLAKPIRIAIHNDMAEESVKADCESGQYCGDNNKDVNNTSLYHSPLTKDQDKVNQDLDKDKDWSDTNIEDHNKSTNSIFDELLGLDPSLLSENLFDEKQNSDPAEFNSSTQVSNTSSGPSSSELINSPMVVVLPEPPDEPMKSNLLEKNESISSKDNQSLGKAYESMMEIVNPDDSPKTNSTNESQTSTDSDAEISIVSEKEKEKDQNEFISTIAQVFHLLLSKKTLQVVQRASSSAHNNLQDRYYTHIIDLLKVLKRTLSQLESPHDKKTENVLLTTMKQLVKTISFIYTSQGDELDTEQDEEPTFVSRTIKADTLSLIPNLSSIQNIIRSHLVNYMSQEPPQKKSGFGDLGDIKRNNAKAFKEGDLTLEDLKKVLPTL